MNVLIVGAGSVGKRHMKNAASLGHSVSVVDPRADRLDECDIAVDRFGSLDDALQKEWNGVVICSPPNFHIDQLLACQSLGIPLLVEKPLSNSLKAALDAWPMENVLLGYTYRWWEPILYFKEILFSKSMGNILNVRCCMAAHLADWHPWEHYTDFFMSHKHMGGGALLDESHILDLILWLFGRPNYVSATVTKLSSLRITTDDNVEICMEYENWTSPKMFITVHLDLFSRPHKKEIIAIGENGTAEWLYDSVTLSSDPRKNREFKTDRNEMFMGVMNDYIQLLEGQCDIKCSYEDGCNVLKLISEIQQSSDEKRSVKCEPLAL